MTELLDNGFTQERLVMYMGLLYEDFIDILEEDIVKLEESQIQEVQKTLESVTMSDVLDSKKNLQFTAVLNKVYGLNGESKFNEFMLNELELALEDIKKLKTKFQGVDLQSSEIQSQMENLKNDPDYNALKMAIESLLSK